MSFAETAGLGGLAGITIYLGLPLGRVRTLSARSRVALAMLSVGILAFILVDVLQNALAIVQASVDAARHGHGRALRVVGRTLLLGAGFGIGCSGLAVIERRLRSRGPNLAPIAGGAGPALAHAGGASTAVSASGRLAGRGLTDEEISQRLGQLAESARADAEVARLTEEARRRALQRGIAIALAIGLHNFAEGLAIGVSARAGAMVLATVLVIGFALHNSTEGFGIVGPLGDVIPSWKWLGGAGLIAGGPTFVGAMVGHAVTSLPLELAFYALAGGAVLYVIGEVWQSMRRFGYRELALFMLATGFMIGVITDLVVTYGGG
jgi:ZIP family zinc transporter